MPRKTIELQKAEAVLRRSEYPEGGLTSDQVLLHSIGHDIVHALARRAAQGCAQKQQAAKDAKKGQR